MKYFKGIFTTSVPNEMEQIFRTLEMRISNGVNENLLQEFTKKEIKLALGQIHLNKGIWSRRNDSEIRQEILRSSRIGFYKVDPRFPQ